MPYMIAGSPNASPEIIKIPENIDAGGYTDSIESIKIMTLNLAHGRGVNFNQLFVSKNQIDKNINTISHALKQVQPDIAGFQEADGPSFWSGHKDHIKQIAEQSGMYSFFHGYHITAPYLSYGTAMASRWNIQDAAYVTFTPSLFAPPKGFSVGSFKWPGTEIIVDVIILHLDFISESKRNSQIEEIRTFMEKRAKRPVIAMGDFNSTWSSSDSSVKKICSVLNLRSYKPDDKNLSSFPFTNKRIDWVLISNQLEFSTYKALDEQFSDHLAVVCDIKLLRK
ncbi:endonuclease/exonuclease/phosphatase family protein [Desulforegula conservatrix]|uniref:endonuclease/exonuclease/phosphatase family protein n=1 Tax=Desulforegula conservatrix TaxID=153026 RepID=UPI0018DE38A3|nr:endonuclease/exonuclease/phosphatase family protein [Desulforegula conservatrix]